MGKLLARQSETLWVKWWALLWGRKLLALGLENEMDLRCVASRRAMWMGSREWANL